MALYERGDFIEMFHAIPEIRARLVDNESIALYDARLNFFWKRDAEKYLETVSAIPREWIIPDLDSAYEDFHFSHILLWGCRDIGRHARAILAHSKYANLPMYFVSNTKKRRNTIISIKWQEGGVDTPVIGANDVYPYLNKCVVLVLTRSGRYSVVDQLSNLYGLPSHRIMLMRCRYMQCLRALHPNQYFDVFEPKPDEVFIDAGALDGITSLQFCDWCGGNYEKIIAFEPNPNTAEVCKRFFEAQVPRATLIPKATWSEMTELDFRVDYNSYEQCSSCVSDSEDTDKISVPADSIDHVLNGERATFIKMDIEGSEYQALLGAEQTIKKYHPRLAISLYHKPEDVLEIPYLLYKMNPDYRFIIRHYTSIMTETVLYAFDEEQ